MNDIKKLSELTVDSPVGNKREWPWILAAISMSFIFELFSLRSGGLGDSLSFYFLTGFLSLCIWGDNTKSPLRFLCSLLILLLCVSLTIFFSCKEWLSKELEAYDILELLCYYLLAYVVGMGLSSMMIKKEPNVPRKFSNR